MRRLYATRPEAEVLRTGTASDVDRLFDELMARAQETADATGSPVELWGNLVGHNEFLLAVYPSH